MYEKKSIGWRKHLDFIFLDIICLQIAFVLAYMIRFGMSNPYLNTDYLNLAIFFASVDFGVSVLFESYKSVLRRGYFKEFAAMMRHVALVEGFALLYLFSTQSGEVYSRLFYYYHVPIYMLLTYMVRLFWKKQLKAGKIFRPTRSLLIVAPQEQLEKCVTSICARNFSTYKTIGAVAVDAPICGQTVGGVPVVVNFEDILEYAGSECVDEVFLLFDSVQNTYVDLLEKFRRMGIVTHLAVLNREAFTEGRRHRVEAMGGYVVLTTSLNNASSGQLYLKRLIDIFGGLVGCLFTLLLVILVGPAIYISSPGPIFFAQERVGRNGRKFKMYKFRTMYPDAEARKQELLEQNRIDSGAMFKIEDDPRIIGNRRLSDGRVKKGIGGFLRATSLDEFPQMFNILRGDMSLVGTRPPTVDEWKKYDLHHHARLAFRPGLTGMWQVSGRSRITDFEEVVRLDTEYIDNWSIGLDIKILLKTVKVVLANDGAM